MCCVVGKGPVQQLIRGLPALAGSAAYVSVSHRAGRGSRRWQAVVVALLPASVQTCAGSEPELTAEAKRQAERWGLCSGRECVCVCVWKVF